MKLVAELWERGGHQYRLFYCSDMNGGIDNAVSDTLLSLIEMSSWGDGKPLKELDALVTAAEARKYISPNTNLPDYGFNDVNIWLDKPMAPENGICVTNENTTYCSDGEPQNFTFQEYWQARSHWIDYLALLKQQGNDAMIGKKFEVPFRNAPHNSSLHIDPQAGQ